MGFIYLSLFFLVFTAGIVGTTVTMSVLHMVYGRLIFKIIGLIFSLIFSVFLIFTIKALKKVDIFYGFLIFLNALGYFGSLKTFAKQRKTATK